MPVEADTLADTTVDMAKSDKKTGREKRKTPRVNVGVPEDWHAVARRLASKRHQPVIYVLIDLLKAEAEKQGLEELPSAPWEDEDDAD
jgi:hypothetical protein